MNPIEGLAYGFGIALTPMNLAAGFGGALLGTLIGVLPGIGPVGGMAMLLSVTLTLPPETAIIMLAGIYYGAMYGGSTTSILVNVPGEATSIVTCIDGFQMAKKGRAGAALAVAAVGSFLAGTVGIIGLMIFAPPLAQFALVFGPPEYFALMLLGLLSLSRLSGGSVWRSILMLSVGLAIASVGMDIVSGYQRFTFGYLELTGGIELVPAVMGLFGLSEMLFVAEELGMMKQVAAVRFRDLWPTREEWKRALWPIWRGTGIGFVLGLMPGPSTLLSTFVSYKVERQLSQRKEEFGQGAIEGVAGPEAANNAATSAHMIPFLALGVPWGAALALLLAALIVQGVQPGPLLIKEHPEVFWGVVASMYVGNVMLLVLNYPLVGVWASLLRFPQSILCAVVLLLMVIGAYSINNSMFDLWVLVTTGIAGYVLRKLHFDLTPIALAMVLGPLAEKAFRQSLFMGRGDLLIFLERPISAFLVVVLVIILAGPSLWSFIGGRRRPEPHAPEPVTVGE